MLKRILVGISLLGHFLVLSSSPIKADVMNPEWFEKKCDPGERDIVCEYRSQVPFGAPIYDECQKYQANPNYRYLTGHGSSFGGEHRYCTRLPLVIQGFVITSWDIREIARNWLITVVIELVIFALSPLQTLNYRKAVLVANTITVPTLYLFMTLISSGWLSLLIGEILIVFCEAQIITKLIPVRYPQAFRVSVSANVASVIIGTFFIKFGWYYINQIIELLVP